MNRIIMAILVLGLWALMLQKNIDMGANFTDNAMILSMAIVTGGALAGGDK